MAFRHAKIVAVVKKNQASMTACKTSRKATIRKTKQALNKHTKH